MSAGKVMLVAMIAMATGAALGVLLAPDKGSATRKRLSKEGTRALDAVKSTATEAAAALEEKIDDIKEAAVDLSNTVKKAVDPLAGRD